MRRKLASAMFLGVAIMVTASKESTLAVFTHVALAPDRQGRPLSLEAVLKEASGVMRGEWRLPLRWAVSAELSQGPDTPTCTLGERVARSPLPRTLAAVAVACVTLTGNAQDRGLRSPRLYVLDGGVLASETARYRLKDSEVEEVFLAVASYLIVHPRGVLMWDAGAIADHERTGGVGSEQRLQRRDGQKRFVKLAPTSCRSSPRPVSSRPT